MQIGTPGGSNLGQMIVAGQQLKNQGKAISNQRKARQQALYLGLGNLGLGAVQAATGLAGTVGSLAESAARRQQSGTQFQEELANRQNEFGQNLTQQQSEQYDRMEALREAREQNERLTNAELQQRGKLASLGTTAQTNRDLLLGRLGREGAERNLLESQIAAHRAEGAATVAGHGARMQRPIDQTEALKYALKSGQALGGQENQLYGERLGIQGGAAEALARSQHQRDMEKLATGEEYASERQENALNRNAPYVYDRSGQKYPFALAQLVAEQQAQQAALAQQRQMPGISGAAQVDTAAGINRLPLGPADIQKSTMDYRNKSALQREAGDIDISRVNAENQNKPPSWEKSPEFPEEMNTRRQAILNQLRAGLIGQMEASRQLSQLNRVGSTGYLPEELSARNAGATDPQKLQNTEAYLAALEAAIADTPETQQPQALMEIVRRRMLGGGQAVPGPDQDPNPLLYSQLAERDTKLKSILAKIGY